MGPKSCPAPMPLGVLAASGGEGPPLPSLPRPLLPGFCSLFLAVNYAKGGGEGRVGGGKRGRSWKAWGTGPRRKEPSSRLPPSPPARLRALSHGVLEEKGAGWPEWLARPWGQREGPAPLGSPPRPCPPLPRPRAGNVLFPPLPPRGQRAGRAGWLLPSSPPPAQVRAGAAAGPPLTHAAPGLARRGLGDGVRGCGPAERAGGRPLAAAPGTRGRAAAERAPKGFRSQTPAGPAALRGSRRAAPSLFP